MAISALAIIAPSVPLARWRIFDDGCVLFRLLRIDAKFVEGMNRKSLNALLTKRVAAYPTPTVSNSARAFPPLKLLGHQIGLTDVEQLILLVILWLRHDALWRSISTLCGQIDYRRFVSFLATLLNVTAGTIKTSLHLRGALTQSGLVEPMGTSFDEMESLHDVLAGLDEDSLRTHRGWKMLLRQAFSPATRPPVSLIDFHYLQPALNAVMSVLTGAIRQRARGVHILLYGPPGTGKTVLAHAIAGAVHGTLRPIRMHVERPTYPWRDTENPGIARFRWLLLWQHLLKGSEANVFLFDEGEDLFPAHPGIFFRSSSAFMKGWINTALEDTPSPTIWTANDISWMDPAHVRRFSCILEVPNPPRRTRAALLRTVTAARHVSDEWISRLSESSAMTPAQIGQLQLLVDSTEDTGAAAELFLESILREKILASGNKSPIPFKHVGALEYDLVYLNTSVGGEDLARTLATVPQSTTLFYGMPGTGKTALARYIAEAMNRPIIIKRASDLLSKWVGDTEKLIAAAFREAERERAILFLDEADSFLRNREIAHHIWEVTQVNELLVNMENFPGTFIASTNLVADLDPAAFRRFDLKIEFYPLTPAQKLTLLRNLVPGIPEHPAALDTDIFSITDSMPLLTIGDFRAALRHLSILGKPVTVQSLRTAIEEEYKHKPNRPRAPFGFIAS